MIRRPVRRPWRAGRVLCADAARRDGVDLRAASLYAIVALALGAATLARRRRAYRDASEPRSLRQAVTDACRLRYLDGGGVGCMNDEASRADHQLLHHLTFYGFLLCFAATCVATLYHYLLAREAPIRGTTLRSSAHRRRHRAHDRAGGTAAQMAANAEMADEARFGMDAAFIVMLFLTGATGLALLALRDGAAMGLSLSRLGVVFALFITMPYGKFVHGIYHFCPPWFATPRSAWPWPPAMARYAEASDPRPAVPSGPGDRHSGLASSASA